MTVSEVSQLPADTDLLFCKSHASCNLGKLPEQSVMAVPQKVENRTRIESSNPILGTYPQEMKIGSRRDTCTLMFIAASLTIQDMEMTKVVCPLRNEKVKKAWPVDLPSGRSPRI